MDSSTTKRSPGGESKPTERRPKEETARLGRQIYERDIRHQVEADHVGEIVAIDVDSGNWAIGDDLIPARENLQAKRPEVVNVLFERVGYLAVSSIGGGLPRRTD